MSRKPFPFLGNSGVTLTFKSNIPIGICTLFFDQSLAELIVQQTNKYAAKIIDKKRPCKLRRKSIDLLWHDTNVGEMYIFLGLIILQGIVQKPSFGSYHSKNPLPHLFLVSA